jgi:hypothetical protein
VGITAAFAHSLFWTMTLLSAEVFFWMCWSATMHTLPGEFFPPHAVASVYGFGGTGSTTKAERAALLSAWMWKQKGTRSGAPPAVAAWMDRSSIGLRII